MVLRRSPDGRALRWQERADPAPLVVRQLVARPEREWGGWLYGCRRMQSGASGRVAALRDGLMTASPRRPDEAEAEAVGRLVEREQQPTDFRHGQRDQIARTAPFSCSAWRAWWRVATR